MSRPRFELRAREAPSRCVLCHEAGGAVDRFERCSGCGALTHGACLDEFGRACPTIGCQPKGDLKTAAAIGARRVEGMGWIREEARVAAVEAEIRARAANRIADQVNLEASRMRAEHQLAVRLGVGSLSTALLVLIQLLLRIFGVT